MSEKFTLLDILAFAKAGWKPADVKDVIALSETKTASEEPEVTVQNDEQQPETVKETETPVQDVEEVPDYKKMYEEAQKQNDKLKSDLTKAQSLNITQNVAPATPKLTGQEAVNQIFKEVIF